jgi:hypothetical protein
MEAATAGTTAPVLDLANDELTEAMREGHLEAAEALRPLTSTGRPVPVQEIGPNGGGGTGGPPKLPKGPVPATPLPTFKAYVNNRPNVDNNTCGQAAIASMVDFNKIDPWGLPRPGGYWNSGAAIDAVKGNGYGPDVMWGLFGTSPGRIRDALQHYGVPNVKLSDSGAFSENHGAQWNLLLAYVYYSALPVPVLIDTGLLGGTPWGAHWPIVWKMEKRPDDMYLYLGNWSSAPVKASRFLDAWGCRHLPPGFKNAAIYCGTPKVVF